MPTRITDRDRAEAPQVQLGQIVCIIGRGSDNLIHRHQRVKRLTATQIITVGKNRHGEEYENRFTRTRVARSIPYSDYGGTLLHVTCQRPKPKTEG